MNFTFLHPSWPYTTRALSIINLSLCVCLGGIVGEGWAEPTVPYAGFRQAEPGYRYAFPRDHGSHDEFQTEWWYYTGHLATTSGHRYGFELTFFRRAVDRPDVQSHPSAWAIKHLYLAHFALSDLNGTRFRYREKISRAGVGKAGADTGTLHTWIDQWSIDFPSPTSETHHLLASTPDMTLDLMASPRKPPVVHGREGISLKGTERGQASHYYSLTHLTATGTLTIEGRAESVQGQAWMDHEFGSGELPDGVRGWDWFSLQLENQVELMVYFLRDQQGAPTAVSSGTVVLADGTSQHLTRDDITIQVLDFWTSPKTQARYPHRWQLTIPSLQLSLAITPELDDQELITTRSTDVTYWEGAVRSTGTWQAKPIIGLGYVELTGYAPRLKP